MKPNLILAALTEQTHATEHGSGGRFDTGSAYARANARALIRAAHSDLEPPSPKDLPAIDKALRAWINDGPDHDSRDYTDGYQHVQEEIRLILDGDPVTILEALEDAHSRAQRLHREAEAALEQGNNH